MSFKDCHVLPQYWMPCKDCKPPKRYAGCQCKCPEYAEALDKKEKARAEAEPERMSYELNYRYFADSVTKLRRRKNI